jgi:hypothetical protein
MLMEREEKNENRRKGATPAFKAFHQVYITKDLGYEQDREVIAFIEKHIAEFNGHIEDKHGIPLMLFERQADAHKFANEMSQKLNIKSEHISVKAEKFTR